MLNKFSSKVSNAQTMLESCMGCIWVDPMTTSNLLYISKPLELGSVDYCHCMWAKRNVAMNAIIYYSCFWFFLFGHCSNGGIINRMGSTKQGFNFAYSCMFCWRRYCSTLCHKMGLQCFDRRIRRPLFTVLVFFRTAMRSILRKDELSAVI